MKEIEWTNNLSVGAGVIDEQHKLLIKHLNNFAKAVDQQQGSARIGETLEFLIDYTNFHFSEEEQHMKANNYPGLNEHKTQHMEYKETLSRLEEDFREDGATNILATSIDALLTNWLIKHISSVDVKFGAFLKNNSIEITEKG